MTLEEFLSGSVNTKLIHLLETGQFDWDNRYHREAYLKAWLKIPRKQAE